ncbi:MULTISPECIES: NUDIX hydrolase [Pseudomonas]|uniref:GDP-mannose pyrophosphatase n=1 Tax=Pseudomonas piscis TaxID=2614538 RepID=U6ZND7_9PSED|nr:MULTISPECIES: NUDIX hydrolase [Pseudomonas]ERO60712.1 NUDIX hydrolase [Pseudomonas piscis]MQA54812.1 NUDIX domain-containing protein [Pseudomonas piscis]UMZ14317.1 NUDIX hydrolase [Pseudomonas sp. MPFS]
MSSNPDNQCLLETPYFRVVREQGYFIIKEAQAVNGVVAIPTLADGRLMLADLRRRAIGGQSIEFPRGAIDAGESPCDAAARELLEETGWQASQVRQLGLLHSNTSLIASAVAVCQVEIAEQQAGATDGEVDKVLWVSRQELLAMIAAGRITDGHTLSAAMMLLAHEAS